MNVLISDEGVAKLTDFGNAAVKKYTLQFTGTTGGSNISLRWAVGVIRSLTKLTAQLKCNII
jgi:serine/threonine protein kinase